MLECLRGQWHFVGMECPAFEDNWYDVVMKASRGRQKAIEESEFGVLDEKSPPDESVLLRLAKHLGLNSRALVRLAYDPIPAEVSCPKEVHLIPSSWHSMVVNSYLVVMPDASALLFDTGTDARKILDLLDRHRLFLRDVFITHNHSDHIACLDQIVDRISGHIWTGVQEPVPGARTFQPNHHWQFGPVHVQSRSTWGHSKGGSTYVVTGLMSDFPLAFPGDALFAGSMGGGKISFQAAIESNQRELFSLPDSTIIFPGHGAITTIGHERQWNPFFAHP